jgi:uncharacterized protein (TIGR03437 family)
MMEPVWVLALCASAHAQVITTLAGANSVFPISIPALSAPLGQTTAVAVDAGGNVFVADHGNNMVMRLSADGTLTVVAGNGSPGFSGDGGPATHASLNAPSGLALDSSGNLYIADEFNFRIRKVGPDGVISTVAGNGAKAFGGDGGPAVDAALLYPYDVAADKSGNLYIADSLSNRIRKVTPGGTISTIAGTGTAGFSGDGKAALNAQLNTPTSVKLDAAGNILVADTNNNRIRRITPDGAIATVAGNGSAGFSGDGGLATAAPLNAPHGIAADSAGNLYIADLTNERVRKVSANGTISTIAGTGVEDFSGDGSPARNAALNTPSYVAVDPAGAVYIADTNNGRIRKITADGIIASVAGSGGPFSGDGGPGISAALNYPSSVAVDARGNTYIADTWNDRVRKVASDGTITTIAGNGKQGGTGDGGPAASANLDHPYSIALDSAGNLFIADTHNNRIREVTTDGVIHTVAGNGTRGYSGDGGQAAAASFANPRGVAVDGAGNVYIADSFNHVVRKVKTNGVITTIAGTGAPGFAGDGGPAASAMLNTPLGVAVDGAGNVYIVDTLNSRVRLVTADGHINTIAGNGNIGFSGDGVAATGTSVFEPTSLALGSAGVLYIADSFNSRIRKITADGIISTSAGNGDSSFYGDGGVATGAALNYPGAVAVDAAGNLYIADTANSRIREVLAAGTAISYGVSPASLTFSGTAGGAAAGAQTLSFVSGLAGLGFSISANVSWLGVSAHSGSIPAALQISADPGSLAPGAYTGLLTIAVPNATPASATVSVTLTVKPGSVQAGLSVDNRSLAFTGVQGGVSQSNQLQVANSGAGTLAFSAAVATVTGGSWLAISPANGTASPASPASLTVTATPGSLVPGTYSGTVTITGAGSAINVPVTLSVSAPAATILVSQAGLSFTAVAQGGVPLPQNFGILNTGQGSMSWSATAATISGGNWLRISPSNGTVQRPYLDVSLVTVSVDPSSLGAGTYYGRIQVSASATNTPQVMTVILTVLPAGLSLGPQVFPTGLIFTGIAGATPGSQDVQVANPTRQVNNFQSGLIGTAFSFVPTNASVQPNQPTTVRVYPDFSNLTPGSVQQGTITLQFSDRSPSQTINVLMVVAPSGVTPNSAGAEFAEEAQPPAASGCAAQAWSIQFRSLQPNFAAVLGQATAIDVQVADGCGNLVGPGGQSAYVAATVTGGDPTIAMTHIGNGIWQGTWKPVNATGGVTLFVTALGPNGVGGQNKVSGAVSAPAPAAATPTVTAQGVVHAASDAAGVPIAPGGLITVYGVNLSDAVGQNTGLPLPQQLNGTQVLLGNQPLPILYTSTGQLNVQVPFTAPVNTQYQLTVQHGNALSLPQSLVVAAGLPGIFTVNQQGTGQGAIMRSDGVTLAQPGTPASIGETVVIYCTGLGAVTPAVKEGLPAPATPPLSTTVNPVTVTIGGTAAQVAFSGLTPGYAGLYQVNAVVPAGITTGDTVPVVVSVAGQDSPPVTIAVR